MRLQRTGNTGLLSALAILVRLQLLLRLVVKFSYQNTIMISATYDLDWLREIVEREAKQTV